MADAIRALTRADALALDAADVLAGFRRHFVDDDPGLIYVDGNSLGRRPVATADALTQLAADWGARLVGGWEDWIAWPGALGDELGLPRLGWPPGWPPTPCSGTRVAGIRWLGSARWQPVSSGVRTATPDWWGPPTRRP